MLSTFLLQNYSALSKIAQKVHKNAWHWAKLPQTRPIGICEVGTQPDQCIFNGKSWASISLDLLTCLGACLTQVNFRWFALKQKHPAKRIRIRQYSGTNASKWHFITLSLGAHAQVTARGNKWMMRRVDGVKEGFVYSGCKTTNWTCRRWAWSCLLDLHNSTASW